MAVGDEVSDTSGAVEWLVVEKRGGVRGGAITENRLVV